MSLDLIKLANKLANKLDEALIKETTEKLTKFLNDKRMTNNKQQTPHGFCETPEQKCTMNYCDENGCQNRKRTLAEPTEMPNNKQQTVVQLIIQALDIECKSRGMNVNWDMYLEIEKEQTEQARLDAKEIIIIKHTEHGVDEQ
jgi:hypothetical protein